MIRQAELSVAEQQRMCERKRRYASRIDALIGCARDNGVGRMRAYRCPVCRGWHLSSLATYSGPSRPATAGRPG